MALSAKVVEFTLATSTGNQPVTGVGFQPDLVIILCNGTAGVASGNGFSSLGAGVSSSSRWVVGQWHNNASSPSNVSRVTRTDRIIDIPNADGSATDYQADLVSMDANGFTINVGVTGGVGLECAALCLAGSDLEVAVGSFLTGTSTGAGITAVSGLSFEPKAVLTMWATTSTGVGTSTRQNLGFASGPSNQWGASGWEADNAAMITSHAWHSDRYIDGQTHTADDTDISFDAFTSDGWTHDITAVPASLLVCYVALGGSAQFYVGNDAQDTSTGPEPTTGVGFEPVALITNMSLRTTTGRDTNGDFFFHVGFMDGTTEAGGHVFSEDATANADTSRGIDSTYSLFAVTDDATPTVPAKASLDTFDSDGFTLNWNAADGTARLFGFLAIGAAASGGSEYEIAGAVSFAIDASATLLEGRALAGAVAFPLAVSATMLEGRVLAGAASHPLGVSAAMVLNTHSAISGATTFPMAPTAAFESTGEGPSAPASLERGFVHSLTRALAA
ncbi:MAG: hypothetical protein AB7Q01_14990 [Gammaproteobacteria bacterium]